MQMWPVFKIRDHRVLKSKGTFESYLRSFDSEFEHNIINPNHGKIWIAYNKENYK